MSKKRSDKKISTWKLLLSLLAFIIVAGVVVLAAVNIQDLSLESMGSTLKSWFGTKERAETFYYEDQTPVAFAGLDGGLVTVSNSGFTVFDRFGSKTADRSVVMSDPVVVSSGKTAGVYDRGGKTLFIISSSGDVKVYESDNKFTSVSVNQKGWFALCTEEANYKGSVTVLNAQRKAVYKFYSGDGYLLNAVLSDNNKRIAALKLNSSGSQVVQYRLDSEEEQMSADISNAVAVKSKFGLYNGVAVLSDRSFTAFDDDGSVKNSYDISEYTIGDFSLDGDGYSVVFCRSYRENDRSNLVTLDDSGKLISRQEVVKDIKDISASGQYIAVLYSDGLVIYDKNLKERGTYQVDSGAKTVIMCSDGAAIVSGDYFAEVK